MAVLFEYKDIDKRIEYKPVIGKLIKDLIVTEGKKSGEIVVIFTSNEEILRINKSFLNHSYYTDVITFPEVKRDKISGEIYISLDQVEENSRDLKTLFLDEVTRVVIHGVLHLIGYNDQNDLEKSVMRKKEDHYLCRFKEVDFIRK